MEAITLASVPGPAGPAAAPGPLGALDISSQSAEPTGLAELDRVLGGGLIRGGAYLVAGEPGVGKSTLLFQVASRAASAGRRALLICGEETPEQVRIRADRLGGPPLELWATRATDVAEITSAMDAASPALVIVDSVQSLSRGDVPGVPGSVSQVRACADALVRAAKDRGIALVLVGQATKDGQVAGPRTLEHLVDAVLWFEGEPRGSLRLLRSTKNRFGAAHEVGCFAMSSEGLKEVADPSSLLVSRRDRPAPGIAVAPLLEGNRAMLVEVQASSARRRSPHRAAPAQVWTRNASVCSWPFWSVAGDFVSVGTTCSPPRWAACAPSNRRSTSPSRSPSLRASWMLRCRTRPSQSERSGCPERSAPSEISGSGWRKPRVSDSDARSFTRATISRAPITCSSLPYTTSRMRSSISSVRLGTAHAIAWSGPPPSCAIDVYYAT